MRVWPPKLPGTSMVNILFRQSLYPYFKQIFKKPAASYSFRAVFIHSPEPQSPKPEINRARHPTWGGWNAELTCEQRESGSPTCWLCYRSASKFSFSKFQKANHHDVSESLKLYPGHHHDDVIPMIILDIV